jgi:hypothetical protein
MGQTSGPSTRASGLDGRRARVQADETHAILALADIIAKGNALVHFGAPAVYSSYCKGRASRRIRAKPLNLLAKPIS